MIAGLGVDAVNISRISKLNETAIKRIFSVSEIAEYESLKEAVPEVRNQFLASRFAVKEAYAKARGLGFGKEIAPNEIAVVKDNLGKPSVVLSGKTLEYAPKHKISVSITHEDPLAIAFVVLEEA